MARFPMKSSCHVFILLSVALAVHLIVVQVSATVIPLKNSKVSMAQAVKGSVELERSDSRSNTPWSTADPPRKLPCNDTDDRQCHGASNIHCLDEGETPLRKSYEHQRALRRLSAVDNKYSREERERAAGRQTAENYAGRRDDISVESFAPYGPVIFFQTFAQRWAAPRFAAFLANGNAAFELDGFEFGY